MVLFPKHRNWTQSSFIVKQVALKYSCMYQMLVLFVTRATCYRMMFRGDPQYDKHSRFRKLEASNLKCTLFLNSSDWTKISVGQIPEQNFLCNVCVDNVIRRMESEVTASGMCWRTLRRQQGVWFTRAVYGGIRTIIFYFNSLYT